MALSQIQFNKNAQGLSRTRLDQDHISGLLFFTDSIPSGYTSTTSFGSLQQAQTAGFTSTYEDGIPHYHISEFFRINPEGLVYVKPVTGGTDYSKLVEYKDETSGIIRQYGVYTQDDFALSAVTTIQTYAEQLETENAPASILFGANVPDWTALPDLTSASAPKVSVVVGQDGAGDGASLFASVGKSITCLGATLGQVSKSSVHESIAWVQEGNVSGEELNEIALADGTDVKTLTRTQLGALNDKRYIFLITYEGATGSYFNSGFSADDTDFDSIHKNRTIDKAVRLTRANLLPRLNSPIQVDSEGKLATSTIRTFEALASRGLEQMESAGELSAFAVSINPDQDVLSNDQIEITLQLVPFGEARTIVVNIGFTTTATV